MDTSAFDKKITNLEEQVEAKKNEMEEIYNKFIDATIIDSRKWSKNQIEKFVETEHEFTLSKNESFLKDLKLQCRNLIMEIPSIVEENLNDDNYWLHNKSLVSLMKFYSKNQNYHNQIEKRIKEPLGKIRGHTGKILAVKGYINTNSRNCEWSSYNDGTIRYDAKFDLNEDMKKIIENYAEKSRKLEETIKKIKSVENDKARYMAKTRWKEIKLD